MSNILLARFFLVLIAFIWGSTFIVIQDAIQTMQPFSFLAVRFGISAAFLALITVFVKRQRFWTKEVLKMGGALGGFLFLGFTLQTLSLFETTSANSAFFTGVVVVIVPFVSLFLLRTKIHWPIWISVIITLIGMYLLSGSDLSRINPGDFLAFLSAFAFAFQLVLLTKWSHSLPLFSVVTVQISVIALLSLLFAMILEPWQQMIQPEVLFHEKVLIAILITSIFATVVAYLGQAFCQRYISPIQYSLIVMLEPIFALGLDYQFNGIIITVSTLMGCMLILLGIFLSLQSSGSNGDR